MLNQREMIIINMHVSINVAQNSKFTNQYSVEFTVNLIVYILIIIPLGQRWILNVHWGSALISIFARNLISMTHLIKTRSLIDVSLNEYSIFGGEILTLNNK